MATYMRDDGLGPWNEVEIDGAHVEWRRREYRADEALLGTNLVVDISLDGEPPVAQADFDDIVALETQLELRVRLLR